MNASLAIALLITCVTCSAQTYNVAAGNPDYAEPLMHRPSFTPVPPEQAQPVVNPAIAAAARAEKKPVMFLDGTTNACPPLPKIKENATREESRLWTFTIIGLYSQCASSK